MTDAPETAGPVLARFDRPRSDDGVELAFVADVHLATDAEGTWKLYHRTADRLRTAVDDADARGVDLVVFGGDLTRDGEPEEFDRFDELVGDLDAPYVAVPGNHDVPKSFDDHESPTAAAFAERYGVGSFPFVRNVGDVPIVGLNSSSAPDGSLADTWGGGVSEDQLSWLDEHLPDLADPVVVVHHNLAAQPEHVDDYPWNRFPMADLDPFVDRLRRHDVPLVLSGHHHLPAVNDLGVVEVMAPAVCSFPQAYLLLEIDDRGTTVRLVPLADRDGTAEAWTAATTGDVHAVGTAAMAETRLASLPLYESWTPDELRGSDGARTPDEPRASNRLRGSDQ